MRRVAGSVVMLPLLLAACGAGAVRTTRVGTGTTTAGSGFYVSPNGNDSNPGTLAAPFATLGRAQQAMEGSSIKTTYVEGGTYHLTSGLVLTAADNGEIWQYYSPDGVDSAILDGGGTVSGGVISVQGGSNITIDGLTVQNFADYGIVVTGGPNAEVGGPSAAASGNTVENCMVTNPNGVAEWNTGGIEFFDSTPNSTISHNYVYDMPYNGIGITTWFSADDPIGGSVIEGNVVINTVHATDGGAIYVGMHGGYQAPTNGVQILDNYVSDYGGPGVGGVAAIYLDDNANNVLVSGNVIGPAAPGSGNSSRADYEAFEIHNGHDNHLTGNIVDLGSTGGEQVALYFQDSGSIAGMAGNTLTNNVIVANYSGNESTQSGHAYSENGTASDYTIQNNIYFNYGGGHAPTTGTVKSDTNPIIENPEISGSTYSIAAGSPVFGARVNFTPIVGGWGPPGFVIPPGILSSAH